MKTTFIVPKDDDRTNGLNPPAFGRILPPVGLARMAGFVGRHGKVSLVDERITSASHNCCADVAVFFINSYNRQRCFSLATLYRQTGSYVVFTGPMLAWDSAESLNYADSLLVGFGEECMGEFLSDYKQGRAKCFYHSACKESLLSQSKTAVGHAPLSLA